VNLPSYRIVNLAQAFGSLALIAIAVIYFENSLKLEPCYLCMIQRGVISIIGMVCVLAVVHNPGKLGQRVYASLSIVLVFIGIYFSGKQLWLQSLPESQVPSCGIPVRHIFDNFTITEAFTMLLSGDGNCAEVHWQFIGLSMPGWVMVCFVGFGVIGAIQFLRKS
tara:strand:- start:374 stop:868 length:495 start_codon:yes stop_codon:yes gene_type:complete